MCFDPSERFYTGLAIFVPFLHGALLNGNMKGDWASHCYWRLKVSKAPCERNNLKPVHETTSNSFLIQWLHLSLLFKALIRS